MKLSAIRIFLMFILPLFVSTSTAQTNAKEAPYLYVLGIAQDAGYPQAGCFKPHCMPAWKNMSKQKSATSLGLIVPQSGKKYMFEATPNFPKQFYDLEIQAPSSHYEFAGIFLSHAHIGHYAGLMFLGKEAMGANSIPVYTMPLMNQYLRTNGPWSQLVNLNNISLQLLSNNKPVALPQINVTPFLVPHRNEYAETVGFRIVGPNKSAVFIPDINKWEDWDTPLNELVKSNDYVLIDATFYADGELPGRDMSKIPHPLVTQSMTLLSDLKTQHKNKVWFIHINHTNPLLDTNSKAYKEVTEKGFNVAFEGLELSL